jgi:hypothetical protein
MMYAAKCYWPAVTEQELERAAARAASEAAIASHADTAIAYLGSIVFEADELVLCFFDSSSRAAVRTTALRAGIPCERVMDSRWLPPIIATQHPYKEESDL